MELWAEGTYKVARKDNDPNGEIIIDEITGKPLPALDPATGKVIPLRNAKNRPMTTPTVYNIRVNLR